MNDMHGEGYHGFGPVPNQAVDPQKVPSIYNKVISKLLQKGAKVQPKIKIFNLLDGDDCREYEELMFEINDQPKKLQYIQAKDHWTKEGAFLRAIDYVEIFENKKKEEEDPTDRSSDSFLDAKTRSELKKELNEKAESVREEMSVFEKSPEEVKKEIEADAEKMQDAIPEEEIPEVSEETEPDVTPVDETSDQPVEDNESPTSDSESDAMGTPDS
jgi:hypothetical protein